MIISPGRQFIFVHIPKTGGTALALALEGRAMKDDILIGDTPKAIQRRRRVKGAITKGRLWKHSTLADIEGLIAPQDIAAAMIVTLVRNPWDRLVSYYHWLRDQSFDHPAVALSQKVGFSEFLHDAGMQNTIRANPYGSYVTNSNGHEYSTHFIRLEVFDMDAAPMWNHLGFSLALPQVNVSQRRRDYRGYYSEDDRALVENLCAKDIARFGYRFEGTS